MPLPDADPDKRMYKLLKNIDLENLTFEQFQSTAQTVFAEPESEDTLRRIVLINLSRMAVAGQWNGLTTAGGGGEGSALTKLNAQFNGVSNYQTPALQDTGTTAMQGQSQSGWIYYPFLAQYSGDVASISIYIQSTSASTGTIDIGIYSDLDGAPNALIGFGQCSATSTGTIIDSSLSATITTVKGTQYWICWFKNGTDANPTISVNLQDDGVGFGLHTNIFQSEAPTLGDESTLYPTSFNATVTLTNLSMNAGWPKLNVGLKW